MEKFVQNYYEFNGLNEAEEVAKAEAKTKDKKEAKEDSGRGAKYDAYRKKILAKYGDEEKLSKEDRVKFNKEVDDGWTSREEEAAKKK